MQAIATFSSDARVEFKFNEGTTQGAVISAIDKITYMRDLTHTSTVRTLPLPRTLPRTLTLTPRTPARCAP